MKRGQGMMVIIVLILIILMSIFFIIATILEFDFRGILQKDSNSNVNASNLSNVLNSSFQENNSSASQNNSNLNQSNTVLNFTDLTAYKVILVSTGCTDTNSTYENCTVKITGTVKNIGTETITEDFVIHFMNLSQDSSKLLKSKKITDNMVSGQEVNFSFEHKFPHGVYFVRLIVDAVSNIDESDETNNIKSESIRLPTDQYPDLTISSIQRIILGNYTANQTIPYNVMVIANITNIGEKASPATTLARFSVSSQTQQTLSVPPLLAHQSRTVNLTYWLSMGSYNSTIEVDFEELIDESNENNNVLSINFNVP